MKTKYFVLALSACCLHPISAMAAPSAPSAPSEIQPLVAEKPIVLIGKAGNFDFMGSDPSTGRILAAHKGARTLEIIEISNGMPLKAIEVGDAQGVAVDLVGHRYFTGNDSAQSIVIVDSKSLTKTAEIKVDGPVDAIEFDSKNGYLYAAKDDGESLWVLDTKVNKVIGSVVIPGIPEVMQYDVATNRLYLNIKNKNLVVRINPSTNKVDATWSTLPAVSPHGLALDVKHGYVLVAGGNGKLVAIDLKSGKNIATADISAGVDQIAFDSELDFVYSASKGYISVTKVKGGSLVPVGNVPSPKGAHTIAVDAKSHEVWVSFADSEHSYLQKFKPVR
jgi:hypothetical protein